MAKVYMTPLSMSVGVLRLPCGPACQSKSDHESKALKKLKIFLKTASPQLGNDCKKYQEQRILKSAHFFFKNY